MKQTPDTRLSTLDPRTSNSSVERLPHPRTTIPIHHRVSRVAHRVSYPPFNSSPSVESRAFGVQTAPSPAYPDDQLIMISALQHLIFCERQFALIHIEQVWEENRLTAEGRVLHESVDQRRSESRRDVRQATAVRISSRRLGLIGVMDMLEFHRVATLEGMGHSTIAVKLSRSTDLWIPFPVEYKRGKPKSHRADEVQLCAQAVCLEEMLGVEIKQGALFYGEPRRRCDVRFDLMEEFRPILADRVVLSLINRQQITAKGFKTSESGAVVMDDDTRKTVLRVWQEKKQETLTHPFINEKAEIGLLPHLQALLFARHLRGDLDAYPPFLLK